jgi:hypothetical protein
MDLSKKFTTVSKTWAVAPNKELEPPSLGLSTLKLCYFDCYRKFDSVYLFEKLCPPPLLSMIVEASEKRRYLLIVEKCEKGITPDRHWNMPITLPELRRYLGVTWFWTLKYSTKSYKKVLKEMKQDPVLTACQKELLIPYKHYTMLNICLDVDVVQFAQQLSHFQKYGWKPGKIAAADETIFSWFGDAEFRVLIPGKPHPLGFMCYFLAVYSSKPDCKPYVLGVELHWAGDKGYPPTPLESAKKLMVDFTSFYNFSPHIVLDAWFSKSDFITWVERLCAETNSGGVTFALPSTHQTNLFGLLGLGVSDKQWRVAYTSTGQVASFKRVLKRDGSVVEW